ncbi:MAG: hypothetical protein KIC68_10085, partial [Campylobacter concisus]|nr:hypothetical protein [Campylobacter concisus]
VQGRGDQHPDKTYSWADIANNPCVHHLDANGGSSHTNAECRFNDDIKRDDTAGYRAKQKKGKKNPEKDKETKEDSDMEEADASNPKSEGKKTFPTKKDTYVTFLESQPAKVKKAVRSWKSDLPFPEYS